MPYKLLICGTVHQEGLELLKSDKDFEVTLRPNLNVTELAAIIGDYDALIVRPDTAVNAEVLRPAKKLKALGRAGGAIDNIDVAEATRRGVVVMNTPGVNTIATAEHTLSLIMAAYRHIPQATASMKAGKWEKKRFQGHEITDKTLGLLGLGRVGSMVARKACQALKMRVIGYDPAFTERAAAQMGVKFVGFRELISTADVISVHVPFNSSTACLLGPEEFSVMKDGVIIINTAHGGLLNEGALLEALNAGKVSQAALDAFQTTPPGLTALIEHPNVIATPQVGASTQEAQVNVALTVIHQVMDFFHKGVIRNAVNVHSIDESARRKIAPYLDLAGRLGSFLGQVVPAGITAMEVEYIGDLGPELEPITNTALAGLLSVFEGSEVNVVNAMYLAENRGIRVSETTLKEGSTYGPSIEVRIASKDGKHFSVQGALIRRIGYEQRIIGIGPFLTEAVPCGPMLIITNEDRPGMIAGMSGALAARGANIAQLNLSRDSIGGLAMAIINLDEAADDETLETIRSVDGILSVRQVILDPYIRNQDAS